MHPFYKRSIEDGTITREEAQELLECLFIKLNHFAKGSQARNDTLRNITLAGQTPRGEDACNELTYLCLAASARLMLPEPKLNVRFFRGSPKRLLRECCRVLAKGLNVPAIYNDEVAVPALSKLGIPLEDARNYCNDGCSELLIDGKSTICFQVHDSLPLLTETVLDAERRGYETFEDVVGDFKARLNRYMPADHGKENPITFPYFAASIDDCLKEASLAGARYSLWGAILAQVGNTADGLAAIKKLIYEDKALRWPDLVSAIKANYEGHEPLRQMLQNRAPKYGNDDDYADEIVKDIAEYFCDGVHQRAANPAGRGSKYAAGLMCFGIHAKKNLPPSPDGRRQGDFTANSFSPSFSIKKGLQTIYTSLCFKNPNFLKVL
jgi:formate C-acetyltransferase